MLNSSYGPVVGVYEREVHVVRGMPKEDSFSKPISVLDQYRTDKVGWQWAESDLLGRAAAVGWEAKLPRANMAAGWERRGEYEGRCIGRINRTEISKRGRQLSQR